MMKPTTGIGPPAATAARPLHQTDGPDYSWGSAQNDNDLASRHPRIDTPRHTPEHHLKTGEGGLPGLRQAPVAATPRIDTPRHTPFPSVILAGQSEVWSGGFCPHGPIPTTASTCQRAVDVLVESATSRVAARRLSCA